MMSDTTFEVSDIIFHTASYKSKFEFFTRSLEFVFDNS